MDRIVIKDLLLRGIVGINPRERKRRQDVLINATLFTDTRPAAASDAIEDAVNYRTVAKAMIAHLREGQPFLVERLAADLADVCLAADPRIAEVEISVEKPWALRHARSAGVVIRRGRTGETVWRRALATLGSNIDPDRNLREAATLLDRRPGIEVARVSGVYESPALGRPGDPRFHNAALLLRTTLPPEALRDEFRSIEAALGRVRGGDPDAPRPIDIDLVACERFAGDLGGRRVPDPEIAQRAFLALPLAEVAPDWEEQPGQTLARIAATFDPDREQVRPLHGSWFAGPDSPGTTSGGPAS